MKLKFLPFENITLETRLTEEEVLNRLSNYTASMSLLRRNMFSTIEELGKPYGGTINKQNFKIRRITDDGMIFFPVIIGNMENDFENTLIKLRIRLTISDMVALIIFVILLLLFSFYLFDLMSICIVTFSCFFIMYRFNKESLRAKKDLQKFLEASEV